MELMRNTPETLFPDLANAILHTAAYADVFDYPLTSIEIHRYLIRIRTTREVVEQVLQEGKLLSNTGGYYTLHGRESLVEIRSKRESIADRLWPQAISYGRIIASLPFVRMVAVTGSLAMNNVEGDQDIDYMIVTAPGWLWLARALVLAVSRWAAMRGVHLCPNYMVTERALAFPDQTIYTAHELAQMIPLFGMDVYERICRLNRWKDRFLPNAGGMPPAMPHITGKYHLPGLKSTLETALLLPPGAWLERWEMDRKIRQLGREQGKSLESCFAADYCKGHFHQHGKRTEQALRKRLSELNLEQLV